MTVAGLVLAAGGGARLGGRPKALLSIGGVPLLSKAISVLLAGGCTPVHVVLGPSADDAIRLAQSSTFTLHTRHAGVSRVQRESWSWDEVEFVRNPDWGTGMASSLRCGLSSLPSSCQAVVVTLVDQPDVASTAVRDVINAHVRDGASVAIASYQGRRGHPVLFAREHWADVMAAAHGDVGARAFLAAHPELVVPVPITNAEYPDDIDTPEDLERRNRP